jgi:hypothetical protein
MCADWPVSATTRPKQASERSDRAIEERSRDQHHVVTLAQLDAIGLSPRAVCHRTATGRLRRLHRGVYAIGTPSREGRWLAAVLACGDDAVLSHRSAAALWGIREERRHAVDVTVVTRAGRTRDGVHVYDGSALTAPEIATCDAIPCTSVPRTLLDLASLVDRRSLERAVDRAETLRIFDLHATMEAIGRHRGRRGVKALADVLDAYAEPMITRSAAEECFLALVRTAGLPRPLVNASIALDDGTAYSPDFLWRDARLIVEIDGRAYHARRSAFNHDRRRDRRLALAGFETRRYAASELMDDPERVRSEVTAFLRLATRRVRTAANGRHVAETGPSARHGDRLG